MEEFCATANRCLYFRKVLHRRGWRAAFPAWSFQGRGRDWCADHSVSLAGTRRFLRDGTYVPRPTSVTITLSPPIYPALLHARVILPISDWHELIRLRDATRAAIVRFSGEPML